MPACAIWVSGVSGAPRAVVIETVPQAIPMNGADLSPAPTIVSPAANNFQRHVRNSADWNSACTVDNQPVLRKNASPSDGVILAAAPIKNSARFGIDCA